MSDVFTGEATRPADDSSDAQEVELARSLNPADSRKYFERGKSLQRVGRHKAAIAVFTEALRYKPDYAEAFAERAMCYRALGQVDVALKDLAVATSLEPSWMFHDYAGQCYTDLGEDELALLEFRIASSLSEFESPGHQVSYLRATVLDNLGRPAEALKEMCTAISEVPWAHLYFNQRALLHHKCGDEESALADFNQASQLHPAAATYHCNAGATLVRLGRYEAAVERLTRAIGLERLERSQPAYRYRARAHYGLGKFAAAADDYRKVIEIWSKDDEAVRALAMFAAGREAPDPWLERPRQEAVQR